MAGVMVPQKKQGLASQVLPMAAQAGGAAIGGPVGGMVGGLVGSKLAGGGQAPAQPVQSTAISRKIDTYGGDTTAQDIAAANQALAYMPPNLQQKYGPPLQKAQQLQQQQGVV